MHDFGLDENCYLCGASRRSVDDRLVKTCETVTGAHRLAIMQMKRDAVKRADRVASLTRDIKHSEHYLVSLSQQLRDEELGLQQLVKSLQVLANTGN
jgi:hypothetical protein